MRKLYLVLLLICSSVAFGQIKGIARKVSEFNSKNQTFTPYQLFTKNTDVQKSAKYLSSATDVTVLNINSTELNRLKNEAPKFISLSIPYQNEVLELQLFKENVVTDGFYATDEKGNPLEFELGEYYRGIIQGDYHSVVAVSIFEGDVMGVISNDQYGNIVLGKSVDKQDFITYSDRNLLGENPFVCGVDEIEFNKQIENSIGYDPDIHFVPNTEKCVKIYYEIAYKPYQQNGSNIQNTINWITGIQNNIGTLYSNDDINVALHSLKIWTVTDPYTGNYQQNLFQFAGSVTDFEGDLAHLVNTPMTTSVAFLDSLCSNMNYAYSGISMNYAQVPAYSWTIMAMTHEMGHALGSPHTHACAWNGNNTAIDGCGAIAGYSEGCTGPIPNNGGTIMSYCHLTSAGINFNNGFGPQPGALIRATVDSKPCLGTDCSCMFTIQDASFTYLSNGDVQVQLTDTTSTQWKYQVVLFGQQPTENWQTTTSTTFTVSELIPNQYNEIIVMNVCSGGSEGGQKRILVLPGDFCDGTLFTDTGGVNGQYGNNQTIIKTFYPSSPNEKVKLTFERIGLRAEQDYMYVYNGDSIEAPLFENGTITGNNYPGPVFQSTDGSGAITIKFVSDASQTAYGWEAVVDCASMGIEDLSDSHGLLVYPNPTTDVLNISSQKGLVEWVKLNDVSGKLILTKTLRKTNGTLNLGHLPKGVYILTIQIGDKEVTKKIIKN